MMRKKNDMNIYKCCYEYHSIFELITTSILFFEYTGKKLELIIGIINNLY